MQKYLSLIIISFFSSFAFSQDYRGTPILDVKPIDRTIDNPQNKSANLEQELANQIIPAAKIAGAPTGNSTEVGVTEGQLSVSLSGAANYNIPIAVPPGINGVVPQISLVYSSQAGNGMAGYGWNISGISSITRIPSTKFHDGIIDPVDFDGLDRFAFDGQRLLLKDPTQTYGAPDTVYETENFSNVKITAFGGINNNPEGFRVDYPDGAVAYYGLYNSSSKTTWAICQYVNIKGIQIKYSYGLENQTLFIVNIAYGCLPSSYAPNFIQFYYTNRARPEQSWVGGESIILNKILTEIKIQDFRNYSLTYDETSLGYNRLKKITEKSGDNTKEYNPTVFSYDTTINNTLFATNTTPLSGFSGVNNQNTNVVSGDFDADGKTDMIVYFTNAALRYKYTLITDINGTNPNNAVQNNEVGSFQEIFPVTFTNFSNKIFPNQGWCIVKRNNPYSNNYTFQTHNTWIKDINNNFSYPSLYSQIPRTVNFPNVLINKAHPYLVCTNNSEYILPEKKILSGDFNGDGITDVITIDLPYYYDWWIDTSNPGTSGGCYKYPTNIPGGKTYFIDLKTDVATNYFFEAGNIQGIINSNSNIQVVDFNGDGRSDLMVFREGNVQYYTLDQNNQLVQIYNYSEPGFQNNKPLLIGDYNGDGKTDFCIPQVVGQDNWNFYFSSGTGLAGKNGAIGIIYRQPSCDLINYYRETYYIASDFNSDGKADIIGMSNSTTLAPNPGFWVPNQTEVMCDPNYNGTQPIRTEFVFCENRLVNCNQIVFIPTPSPWGTDFGLKRYPIIATLDHNNPRNKSEFSLIQDNKIVTFKQPKDSSVDMMLRKITTGNGVEETITYKPLKKETTNSFISPNVYFPEEGLPDVYPNANITIAPSFKVVTKLEKQSLDVYKKQFFTYAGAVSNSEGLGFLGFRSTMRTNWHNGIAPNYLISNVSINDISLRGANVEKFSIGVLQNANTNLSSFTAFISKSKNTYNKHFKLESFNPALQPNKVFKLYLTDSEQFNGLENTKSTIKTRYDVFNNPFVSTTNLYNGTTLEQTTYSSVAYENNIAIGTYYVGRPLSKKTNTIIYPTQTTKRDENSSEELYAYTNNLLSEIKKRSTNSGQTSNYLTEQNDYDIFSNITQKRILATGLPTRTTNYQYNPTFPFNGRFLTKSIDIEGLATEFTYNPSNGLLISEKNPYNLTTSYEYDKWFKKTKVTDYLGKSKYFAYRRGGINTLISTSADDDSFSYELFDDLGRKFISASNNVTSFINAIENQFDIHDRCLRTSEPNNTYDGANQWNENTFDPYGRPTRTNSFTGKFVTINYNGLSTTVSENVTLPTPMIVKSKTSIKNAMGQVTSMTETLGGTPGGTINYTYFANGNLKTTEFGGATTTIIQDAWGRKKQLDDSSAGTYQYTYNDFGETLTETVRATATGNIKGVTTYTIDDVGKVSQKTIVGQNGDLTNSKTQYTYDPTDKLLKKMRFDDFTAGNYTNYTYGYDAYKRPNFNDESGFLAYYQRAQQYDAFGRLEKELYTAINTSDSKSSSKWIRYTFKNGYQFQIIDDATNKVLREIKTVNARGQLTQALNGYTTESHNYDTFGLQTNVNYTNLAGPNASSTGTAFLSLNTNFDSQRGNLLSRSNPFTNATESFTYDNQDRLLTYPNETGVTQT